MYTSLENGDTPVHIYLFKKFGQPGTESKLFRKAGLLSNHPHFMTSPD